MTLKQIHYFLKVVETGNITAAAAELFVSRTVLSRAIAELEAEFGTTVFTRSKNGVVLTESGKLLEMLFQQVASSYSATKEKISHMQDQKGNHVLRVGVTPTNAYCLYRAYYDAFRKENNDIHLQVEEHGANEAFGLLMEGKLDVHFTPAQVPDPTVFGSLELYQNSICLGVQVDSPLAKKQSVNIEDMLELPLAFFNAPMPIEEMLHRCYQALGRELQIVLRTSDRQLLKELTQQGVIYPILPLDMMSTWEGVQQLPLNFLSHITMNRLVWNRVLPQTTAMEQFLTFMRRQVP